MAPADEIRLSVCIATFNRAAFIGETLESIVSQATEGVEIVILDGGSADDTRAQVERFATRFPRLRYHRQDTNSGVDRDFNTAVELARGEYCWLMSDDDLLRPGAIRTVLEALSRSYSLLIVNAEVRSFDFSRLLEERRLTFEADRTYGPQEMDRLFVEAGGYMTFIGCVVIRRSLWMQREKEPYYGSLFIHAGVIFQQHLPGATLAIAAPLITIRYGNAMWRPKEFEIWMFKWPGLIWSLAGLSASARNSHCRAEPWRKAKTLLYYRARGTYSMTEYRRWIQPRGGSFRATASARAIALMPGSLANVLALLYYSALGPKWRMAVVDMRQSRFYYRKWFTWVKVGG